MNYLAFLGIILPFQLLLVTAVLYYVRGKTYGSAAGGWLPLLRDVLLLMLAANVISLLPVVGVLAVIVWLVALNRLSGLDVIPTFILSFGLGVVVFAAMVLVARYLELPLGGHQFGT